MSDSEEEESPDRQLKLVVLGDGTTGKVSAGPRRQHPAPLRRRGAPSPLSGFPPQRSPGLSRRGGSSSWRLPVCRAAVVAIPGGLTPAGCSPSTPSPCTSPSPLSPPRVWGEGVAESWDGPWLFPAGRGGLCAEELRGGAAWTGSVLGSEASRRLRPLAAPDEAWSTNRRIRL